MIDISTAESANVSATPTRDTWGPTPSEKMISPSTVALISNASNTPPIDALGFSISGPEYARTMKAQMRKMGMIDPTAKPSPCNMGVPTNSRFAAIKVNWIDKISIKTNIVIRRKRTTSLEGLLRKCTTTALRKS